MPFESSITSSILKYLNGLPGCIAEKVKGDSSASGRADINGCYRGQSFRIEVKTPDNRNKASTKQKINLRKWYNSGCLVIVTYSVDFIKTVFSDWIQKGFFKVKRVEKNHCISWARKRSK